MFPPPKHDPVTTQFARNRYRLEQFPWGSAPETRKRRRGFERAFVSPTVDDVRGRQAVGSGPFDLDLLI
jgi:hypothetical protein